MTNEGENEDQLRKRNSWAAEVDDIKFVTDHEQTIEQGPRRSLEAAELFTKGFGTVKKGQTLR